MRDGETFCQAILLVNDHNRRPIQGIHKVNMTCKLMEVAVCFRNPVCLGVTCPMHNLVSVLRLRILRLPVKTCRGKKPVLRAGGPVRFQSPQTHRRARMHNFRILSQVTMVFQADTLRIRLEVLCTHNINVRLVVQVSMQALCTRSMERRGDHRSEDHP